MSIQSPHLDDFNSAKKIEKAQTIMLWIATIFALVSFSINIQSVKQFIVDNDLSVLADRVQKTLNILISVLAVLYSILEFIVLLYFDAGGKKKRNDLIDNSFGSNLNGIRSNGYFSNSNLNNGLFKLAVNCFESSYFTATIVSKMLLKKWITAGALVIAILLSVFSGNLGAFNSIIQLSVTAIIIQQTIKLQWYYFKMNQINQDFKILFNNLMTTTDHSGNSAEMLRNVLNYECTHAWGCILQDSDIYEKLNPKLIQDWNNIKAGYNIQ